MTAFRRMTAGVYNSPTPAAATPDRYASVNLEQVAFLDNPLLGGVAPNQFWSADLHLVNGTVLRVAIDSDPTKLASADNFGLKLFPGVTVQSGAL